MYDLLDRPTADLPRFEADVLAATRRWVHTLTLAGHAPAASDGGAFEAVMAILERDTLDMLVLQRPCHPLVEETEAVLIGLWRLARADRVAETRQLAAALVGDDSAPGLTMAVVAAARELG